MNVKKLFGYVNAHLFILPGVGSGGKGEGEVGRGGGGERGLAGLTVGPGAPGTNLENTLFGSEEFPIWDIGIVAGGNQS